MPILVTDSPVKDVNQQLDRYPCMHVLIAWLCAKYTTEA